MRVRVGSGGVRCLSLEGLHGVAAAAARLGFKEGVLVGRARESAVGGSVGP
jgi:hypothetical protein